MPIEKGNIYVLPLVRKIIEHNLLIFDIDGKSARLHISKLSNNKTLSERMFELFEVGQEVAVVVLEYNEGRNYYELSTKAFRNALDDTLSFSMCQNIIKREYKEYANLSPRHIQQYRAILDRLRGDLSSTGLTFLYELLQNAVDHPNRNFNNEVSVHFEIFENYFLFKHNGALFTENNFRSITGILFGEQNDENNIRRIGYKGIGFKSVFRHSTNVYIRSGNFSFAFTKETGENKPWEVMPVFQNEIEKITEIKQFDFFNSPVAFALEFPNDESKENVINYLSELSENPYLLIFLKQLIKLKISIPNKELVYEKEIVIENGQEIIKLKQPDGTINDWLKFSGEYQIIEDEIIRELTDENNKSVPSNFRKFRTPKIDIVIPKEDNHNLVNLFTYLPMSATKYQLPYIVNGDFIPNLDRTNLIPTLEYNYKVAKFVAEELLKSCEKLAKKIQYEYLKKLIPNYELENNRYANTVKEHFLKKVIEYPIFPSTYSNNLIKLDDLIIDKTGVQNIFSENDYSTVFNTNKKPLASNFGTTTKIEFLIEETGKGSCFTVENLKEKIFNEEFQEWLKIPENNLAFIKHILDSENLEELLKEPIYLTNFSVLKKSTEIYKDQPNAIKNFDVEVLHSEILPIIKDENIKFKKYTPLEFLNEIISDSKKEVINEENLIRDWNWIFDNWNEIKKETKSKKVLQNKVIICKNNKIKEIQNTYVSDDYQVEESNKIETIFLSLQLEKDFVSAELISSKREKKEWIKIFKELEAKSNLQDVITDIIENLETIADDQKHFKIAKEIFKYWNKKYDSDNNLKDHLSVLRLKLKIKTLNQNFHIPSETIISDHYLTGTPLNDVLPTINLQNGISDEYDKNGNNNNWFLFFKEILNCQYINQTQEVFDTKIEYYILNQKNEYLRDKHYQFLKDLDTLLINKLITVTETTFDNFQLKDSDSCWMNANTLFLPSIYKPKLYLESDNAIKDISFLNTDYKENNISKKVLLKIGILQDFDLKKKSLKRSDLPYEYKLFWDKEYNYIRGNLAYKNQHRIENHISTSLNLELIETYKYAQYFWESIKESPYKIKLLSSLTSYKTAYRTFTDLNFVIFSIQKIKCFPNKSKELSIPSHLYSIKLEKYILKQEVLPLIDLSEIINESGQSLEEIIGIQQTITPEIALNLISELEPNLTEEDVEFLNLIEILENTELENDTTYFLPNTNYEWKPITELFQVDEEFLSEIEDSKKLHQSFEGLIDTFPIKKLSESNLVRDTENENDVSDSIITFFKKQAKYIAFKIDNKNWNEIEEDLKNKFESTYFFECSKIKYVFPSDEPIEIKDVNFIVDDEKVYFTGFWKNNDELITFLHDSINIEALPQVWFKNLIIRWEENEIIEKLKDDFGSIPESWGFVENNTNNEDTNEPSGRIKNNNFVDDVNEFIKELEDDGEWKDYVPDLKNILTLSTEHPEEKRKLFNLMAKIKLAKERNIHFGDLNNDYNKLENGEEKFIVHSARGTFAYIHPSEILQMKNEGYKMALDFSTKSPIKIYETAEEILMLNKTHILAYRGENYFDDLISFCEANRQANKHLLIIDKANADEKSKALSKLLNMDDNDFR